jgi:hypothetical protein
VRAPLESHQREGEVFSALHSRGEQPHILSSRRKSEAMPRLSRQEEKRTVEVAWQSCKAEQCSLNPLPCPSFHSIPSSIPTSRSTLPSLPPSRN